MMLVDQAVFTSSRTRKGQGYHVVAQSAGISKELAVALTRWCPSHDALQASDIASESLNYHPLTADLSAISRTLYGEREFSGRGGLQVVTLVVVLNREQLAGFEHQAFRLARVARSLGYLRWQPNFPERLDRLELPEAEFSESFLQFGRDEEAATEVQTAVELLRNGHRVAVIGNEANLGEKIVDQLGERDRRSCSFATCLKPSSQRPFQLQLFREIESKTLWRLQSDNVQLVRVPTN